MPVVRSLDPGRREELLRLVNEFARTLKDRLGAVEVHLHGSLVEGGLHEGSDIDLVVVAELPGRVFERITRVLELTDLPVEPLVYTPAEFQHMVEDGDPFIRQVLSSGQRLI